MKRVLPLLCLSVLLAGDRCSPEGVAQQRWREGAGLVAETAALRTTLAHLVEIERTPLARWAGEVLRALPDCAFVEAHVASGRMSELWPALTCSPPDGGRADWLDGHQMAFARVRDAERIVGWLDSTADRGLAIRVSVPRALSEGGLGLLLPDRQPPGGGVLSGGDTLVHARLRPVAGLDLATLVDDDGPGAQMFRLKSELFGGLVLEGSWEIAVYLPEEGRPMPRLAAALDFRHRGAAVAAMEEFIDELERTWPVTRSSFRLDDHEGACLLDLKLLPDLAPCYVATDTALIVGWNPASLRKSLDGDASEEFGRFGGATIDLARFPTADRILSRALGTPTGSGPFPWQRLDASGERTENGFDLEFQLRAGPQT